MSKPKRERVQLRPLNGIVLLDKASGVSSNTALQEVRFLFRAQKAGHTGALDPLASGMLPICFGEASKVAGYLLGEDKAYDVTAKLGVVTDTDDSDGVAIRERGVPALTFEQVQEALQPFIGHIAQRAPIYSALKQGGEPLYAKARRGEVVEAPVRQVFVRKIALLDVSGGMIKMRIECGSGTYIRSIVRDLGEALGCGAHVTALRRVWVTPFAEDQMMTVEQLKQGAEGDVGVLPLEVALAHWPKITLSGDEVRDLSHGKRVKAATGLSPETRLLQTADGTALGFVDITEEGEIRGKRMFSWIQDPKFHG